MQDVSYDIRVRGDDIEIVFKGKLAHLGRLEVDGPLDESIFGMLDFLKEVSAVKVNPMRVLQAAGVKDICDAMERQIETIQSSTDASDRLSAAALAAGHLFISRYASSKYGSSMFNDSYGEVVKSKHSDYIDAGTISKDDEYVEIKHKCLFPRDLVNGIVSCAMGAGADLIFRGDVIGRVIGGVVKGERVDHEHGVVIVDGEITIHCVILPGFGESLSDIAVTPKYNYTCNSTYGEIGLLCEAYTNDTAVVDKLTSVELIEGNVLLDELFGSVVNYIVKE